MELVSNCELSIEDILEVTKRESINIMNYIHNICVEHDIQYTIFFGTLLGAVRHSGYIPWDDDIDIVLTRPMYNKLMGLLRTLHPEHFILDEFSGRVARLKIKSGVEHKGYLINHICVDLFVADVIPDDSKSFNKYLFKLKLIQGMMKKGKIDWTRYSFKEKILVLGTKILGMFRSNKGLAQEYHKAAGMYSGTEGMNNVVISNATFVSMQKPLPENIFHDFIDYKFEDSVFSGVRNYDKSLSLYYGDYMQLPPESERVPMHINVCKLAKKS